MFAAANLYLDWRAAVNIDLLLSNGLSFPTHVTSSWAHQYLFVSVPMQRVYGI